MNKNKMSISSVLVFVIGALVVSLVLCGVICGIFFGGKDIGLAIGSIIANAFFCGALAVAVGNFRGLYFILGFLLGEIGAIIAVVIRLTRPEVLGIEQRSKAEKTKHLHNKYEELEYLNKLRKEKVLTEKEFQDEKQKILNNKK